MAHESLTSPSTVVFSYGFRPFFLAAALWAFLAMGIWIGMLSGAVSLPTGFDPTSWHVHALLFGYLGAVIAGFLLTAIPSWTKRPPISGGPLVVLFLLWAAGRLAVAFSLFLPPMAVLVIDMAFPVLLAVFAAREVVKARNWRNLKVVGLLLVFGAANALFHWEASKGGYAAGGSGARLGVSAGVLMIAVIGGRIIPAFTRNWLKQRGAEPLPVPPEQSFDRIVLGVFALSLLFWLIWPDAMVTGLAFVVVGLAQFARLARWGGLRTLAEPLLSVLHMAYGLLALGGLVLGAAILAPETVAGAAPLHLWLVGAIGTMTLAVMSRATLGHTGRALKASGAVRFMFALVLASVVLRFLPGVLPDWSARLHAASGLSWMGAFALFAGVFGPMMLRPRVDG